MGHHLNQTPRHRRAATTALLSAGVGVIAGITLLTLLSADNNRPSANSVSEPRSPGMSTENVTPHNRSSTSLRSGGASERRTFEPTANRIMELFKDGPDRIFSAELRDPVWAPKMETQISGRLQSTIASKVGIQFSNVHCRASSCLISFELSEESRSKIPASNQFDELRNRFNAFQSLTGPFATRMVEVQRNPAAEWKHGLLLFFSEKEIDPAEYAEWVARSQAKHLQNLARKGITVESLFPTLNLR